MATPRKANPQKQGRKSKYRPHYPELLIKHMREGNNFKSFGAVIDPICSEQTLHTWVKRYPAFLEARKQGLLLLERWAIQSCKAMGAGQVTVVVETTPVLDSNGKPVMDPARPGHVLVRERREPAKINAAVHIFLLKNMLHWSDRREVQHSGTPGGEAIQHEHKHREMTREERLKEIERLRKQREVCGDD